jgi:hypothetical protein
MKINYFTNNYELQLKKMLSHTGNTGEKPERMRKDIGK